MLAVLWGAAAVPVWWLAAMRIPVSLPVFVVLGAAGGVLAGLVELSGDR